MDFKNHRYGIPSCLASSNLHGPIMKGGMDQLRFFAWLVGYKEFCMRVHDHWGELEENTCEHQKGAKSCACSARETSLGLSLKKGPLDRSCFPRTLHSCQNDNCTIQCWQKRISQQFNPELPW